RQRKLAHEALEVALRLRRHRHDHTRWAFSEEHDVSALGGHEHLHARSQGLGPAEAALGQRHGEAAFRTGLSAPAEPGPDRRPTGFVHATLLAEIERSEPSRPLSMQGPQIL